MGRAPCCDKANVKKGPWSPEEDAQLKEYIEKYGTGGNWIALPQKAGLKRCGKSCRLRWLNYLRPNIKHGEFSDNEDRIICSLYSNIGSRWSIIAAQLPGRTDNDIKNYWNTKLKKKLMGMANSTSPKSHLSHHNIKPNTAYNPILLHNTQSSQSPLLLSPALSSSPPYNTGTNYYNVPSSTLSFTGFGQSALLSNSTNSLCTSSSAFLQTAQQDQYLSPNPMQSNYLVFGGAAEPSCSTSDGSYNNKDQHQQKYSYLYGGSSMEEDQDQKLVFSSELLGTGKTQNSGPWLWEETPPLMDIGLEEIKQLISTNTSATAAPNHGDFNYCSSFYFDENKTGERAMLYY